MIFHLRHNSFQLLFFIMCDILFCTHNGSEEMNLNSINQPNQGPNSLLLYYVFTCIVIKYMEIYKKYIVIPVMSPTRRRSISICVFKVVIEMIKSIFILTCLKEQGLLPNFNVIYTIMTISYYFSTEPIYMKSFPYVLKRLRIERFDGLETVYSPVILNIFHLTLCMILLMFLLIENYLLLSAFVLYYAIITNYRTVTTKFLKRLHRERNLLNKFKKATEQELADWKDVCSICLQQLDKARVTNCSHLFHAECIRKWCKLSNECPMCKTYMFGPVVFDIT